MLGKKQIDQTIVVSENRDRIFNVLDHSGSLAQWVPAVKVVTQYNEGGETIGARRYCEAELSGKEGRMVEEVIERLEGHSLTYRVVEESFGMGKMFTGYGFRLTLEEINQRETNVTLETFYTPSRWFYSVLNNLFMRRQLKDVVVDILQGLKTYVEKGSASA